MEIGQKLGGVWLPLAAGSANPLIGDLWFNNLNSTHIAFAQAGTKRAKLEMQANNGAYIMARCDSAGNSNTGVDASSDDNLILFAIGDDGIIFRPNGLGNTAGQVRLDKSGQLHGGVTRKQATGSGRAISGNSYFDILTLSGLDPAGKYILQAHCVYTLTSNTPQFVWGKFNGFWSESFWVPMKTSWEINHIAPVWGQSSYTFQMSPQGTNNGGQVSSVLINAFQLD